jgi:hypothetical protein
MGTHVFSPSNSRDDISRWYQALALAPARLPVRPFPFLSRTESMGRTTGLARSFYLGHNELRRYIGFPVVNSRGRLHEIEIFRYGTTLRSTWCVAELVSPLRVQRTPAPMQKKYHRHCQSLARILSPTHVRTLLLTLPLAKPP